MELIFHKAVLVGLVKVLVGVGAFSSTIYWKSNRKAAIDGPNYEHALVETQDKIIGLQATIVGSPEGPGKISFQLELKK